MTAVEALQSLKKFLESEVANKIKLQKELSEPIEYVNPYVATITLPHKNFIPVDFQVPHILVGMVSGNDAINENELRIRIQCATYGGDIGFQEKNKIPDEKGYMDLLVLIERIKLKLIEETMVGKNCIVEKPIAYGVYTEEITYPYWYGYLEFSLQIPIVEVITNKAIRDFL